MIDSCYGRIIHLLQHVGKRLLITSFVFNEFKRFKDYLKYDLKELGFSIIDFSAEDLIQIYRDMNHLKQLSIADKSLLHYSNKEEIVIITNDKALRREASSRKIETHGSIWLLNMLWLSKKINKDKAKQSFNQMVENGARLPVEKFNRIFD